MKNFKTEIKWGLIFTVSGLLWMVLEKALGWHDEHIDKHAIYTNFFAIIAIVIYVFALKDKRDNVLGGKMTWQQGFVSGMIISLVVALLSPLSQYLTHKIITPSYFENVINYTVENGAMTLENAKAYFNLSSYMIQSAVFALGIGILTSAIVALFMRKS